MVFDNSPNEDEFRAAHGMQSIADVITTFHFDYDQACNNMQTTGKRFHRYSLSSKLHSATHTNQMPFKEKPVVDAVSGDVPGDSNQLPYPAFSSPLEDMTFYGFDSSEFLSQDKSDGSGMTKLERLSRFHDAHIGNKALFTAWDVNYVLRPPSSPIINNMDAKRNWFS